MDSLREGALIQNRYELDEHLGTGGMAQVWRARDRRLERTVAIKFPAPAFAEEPEFLVRFFSEAQSVARIAHPHVVRVLDFGESEGRQFLVMEYVEGGSAGDLMGEPILPERATEIISQSARAAGAAHELGIVHRDIKPANILLTKEGHAKLADFGIAVTAGREPLTATGAAVGSPYYVSPEQASGRDALPASDVYSLGVVLYELLTGRVPFAGNNATAIAIAHVEGRPEPPRTHIPDLAPALDSLVMQCLEKDPDLRFVSGDALASALEVGTGPTVRSPAPTVMGLSRAPRSRIGFVLATVAAGLALLLTVFFLVAARSGPSRGPQLAQPADMGSPGDRKEESPTPESTRAVSVVKSTPSPSPDETEPRTDKPGRKSNEKGAASERETTPSPTPSSSPSPTPSPTGTAQPTPTGEPDAEGADH